MDCAQRTVVYLCRTAKLGWAALRTWPFLKPNLVFAFSAEGLLFSIFPPSSPPPPGHTDRPCRCCRPGLPRVHNPLSAGLGRVQLLSSLSKKKTREKREKKLRKGVFGAGYRSCFCACVHRSYVWMHVCMLYYTEWYRFASCERGG